MYTARLIGDTKNIELRRRMVNVEFTDGTVTFNKEFQFRIDETVEVMKRTVKQYLDELNFTPPTITDFDYVEPTPTEPTVNELERQAWEANFAKLQKIQQLIDCGVFTGTETQVTTLRNKVKTDFKVTYL